MTGRLEFLQTFSRPPARLTKVVHMALEGKIFLIVHPDEQLRGRLAQALTSAGGRAMHAASDDEAWLRADTVLEPDAVVAFLDDSVPKGSWIGDRLRAAVGRRLAVIALAEERRVALRRGYADVVGPPFDAEEVLLVARSSLERSGTERSLTGELAQMSVADLLQTTTVNGQSGHIVLKNGSRSGEIWLRDGRVIDARLEAWGGDDAVVGRQAVLELATWTEGTFGVDFRPVAAPERVSEPTAHLVLEAMRLLDEKRRRLQPGHAGMPDEPPQPTHEQKATHLALLLLNVAASWASDRVLPKILGRMLETSRATCLPNHPMLELFEVDPGGRVAYRTGAGTIAETRVEALAQSIGDWLRRFCAELDRAMPGRFDLGGLAVLTEAHQEDLVTLGFARELGWPTPELMTADTDTEASAASAPTAAVPAASET